MKAKLALYLKLMKWDAKNGKPIFWSETGCFAGESVFLQNPKGEEREENGVILFLGLDVNKKASFLLVVDAKASKN